MNAFEGRLSSSAGVWITDLILTGETYVLEGGSGFFRSFNSLESARF